MLFPVFAVSFTFASVAPEDTRAADPVDTNTAFFEKRYKDWPGAMSRAQWGTPRPALRTQILTAAGLDPLPQKRSVPRAEIFGRKAYNGFTVEKVLIETAPNYWLGANLYRPSTPGRHPAILSPHGH